MIASFRTMWKRLGSFLLVAALTTVAAVAALPAQDGALPIYPGATFGEKADIGKIPASVWAKGFSTEVFSQDDQAVVEFMVPCATEGLPAASASGKGEI